MKKEEKQTPIIYALKQILQCINSGNSYSVIIVVDTMYGLDSVTTWIWNWYKVDKTFSHKKNSDMMVIIHSYLLALKKKLEEAK